MAPLFVEKMTIRALEVCAPPFVVPGKSQTCLDTYCFLFSSFIFILYLYLTLYHKFYGNINSFSSCFTGLGKHLDNLE